MKRGVGLMKKFFISFLVSCICFGAVFTGVDRVILANDVTKEPNEELIKEKRVEKKKKPEQKIDDEVLVLLLGVDGNDLTQEKGIRTDTMMLGKANFGSGEIDLLSIPRDTRVLVNGREDKINHAHSYGGPYLALETVEEFLDLDIDYYVKVDFEGIQEIVDAIGGVEIDVPQRMYYSDPVAKPPLRIDLQPGLQVLDGQKAHDFLRFRRYSDGDIGRVQAQQYFMKELAKQTLKPANLLKIDKLVKTYYDFVDTNIPIGKLLKYALSAGNLDVDNIRTEMIPGEAKYIGEGSYWIYDREDTDLLIDNLFNDYIKDDI